VTETPEATAAYRARWTREQKETIPQRFSTETILQQNRGVDKKFQCQTLREYPGVPVAVQRLRSNIGVFISSSVLPCFDSITEALAKFDKGCRGTVTLIELELALGSVGVDLPKDDALALLRYFGDEESRLSIQEVVEGVRGGLAEGRQPMADVLWRNLEPEDGCIPTARLMACFDLRCHPLVVKGKMTAAAVGDAFAAGLPGPSMTRREFDLMLVGFSCTMPREDVWENFMKGGFGVDPVEPSYESSVMK
jgi:hypothetical protein